MKKLIFLDVDGVLNSDTTKTRTRAYGMRIVGFDPELVAELMTILHETGAEIVISSSWRGLGLPTIREIMADNVGPSVTEYVMSRVIGVTPSFHESGARGREIHQWITFNDENDEYHFAIIDDNADMEPHMDRLFQTDSKCGLTKEIADKVIAFLNNKEQ